MKETSSEVGGGGVAEEEEPQPHLPHKNEHRREFGNSVCIRNTVRFQGRERKDTYIQVDTLDKANPRPPNRNFRRYYDKKEGVGEPQVLDH